MGDTADLIRGVSYEKSEAQSQPGAGLVGLIRATNIQAGKLLMTDFVYVPASRVARTQFLVAGDIVLASSSGSADVVGKSAAFQGGDNIGFGAFCVVLRPKALLSNSFLATYVGSPIVRQRWSQLARGTNINNLKRDHILATPVPLPQMDEQLRTMASIEKLLSMQEAAVNGLRRARRRHATFVRSILETAIPESAPPHWASATVAEAGSVGLGRQRSPKYHFGSGMRPYLRVANVFEDRIETTDVMEMHFDDEEFQRYRLEEGDILLNEGQSPELLGRPAMYRGIPPNVAFTNSLLRFRAKAGVEPEWALLVFRRHLHSGRFTKESRITTNMAHLSAGRFKTVEFPIPPLAEQREIVQRTASQFSGLDSLFRAIFKAERKAENLRAAILSAAFAGRLLDSIDSRHTIPNRQSAVKQVALSVGQ